VRSGLGRRLAIIAAVVLVAAGCEHIPVFGAPDCRLTPMNSYWRADVRGLPVHSRSTSYINNIGPTRTLKADFGSGLWDGGPIGIPYVVVPGSQPPVPISFEYWDESDPGPYPIPPNPPIEGGPASDGDRHVIVVDKDHCVYYETFATYPDGEGGWEAGSGAIWDMASNELHPDTWTSADAAGLPILPGLVRYEEVAAGKVLHAIRITVPTTQHAYVWPARHRAGSTTNVNFPPMGTWLRLSSSVDPTTFDPMVRPIVVALQTYGAIVADNGSAWYMSGVPDPRWDNDKLRQLGRIKGTDFQVVDTTSLIVDPDSGQATTAR
jgi:hypothetical protein